METSDYKINIDESMHSFHITFVQINIHCCNAYQILLDQSFISSQQDHLFSIIWNINHKFVQFSIFFYQKMNSSPGFQIAYFRCNKCNKRWTYVGRGRVNTLQTCQTCGTTVWAHVILTLYDHPQ